VWRRRRFACLKRIGFDPQPLPRRLELIQVCPALVKRAESAAPSPNARLERSNHPESRCLVDLAIGVVGNTSP